VKKTINKRLKRDLRNNLGRYSALFVLIVIAVSIAVGYFEGIDSSMYVFDSYCKENHLEDGYIVTDALISKNIEEQVNKLGVDLYTNFYTDQAVNKDTTLRVFEEREFIDKPRIVTGKLPQKDYEMVLDQIFAKKHGLKVGDIVSVGDLTFKISGLASFPDYTISLKSLSDMLADRKSFGVAIVGKDAFGKIAKGNTVFNYGYYFRNRNLNTSKCKQLSYDVLKAVACSPKITNYSSMISYFKNKAGDAKLIEFSSILNNGRISTVHGKMETNKKMTVFFVVVMFVIIAFIFSISSIHSINEESPMIGTLLASGYLKEELLKHYLITPFFLTAIGSAIGCVLGLTVFISIPLQSMNAYYSLPVMKLIVEPKVLITALVGPVMIINLINIVAIWNKLSISPLRLLHKDLKKERTAKRTKIKCFGFVTRFRIRLFLRSVEVYMIMFIGIFLAGWLMMFGLGMSSSFDNYINTLNNSKISEYQYTLKQPVKLKENTYAEKATLHSFDAYSKSLNKDLNINFYGIDKSSKYFNDLKLPEYGKIVISDTMSKKLSIKIGDKVKFTDSVTGEEYSFVVEGIYKYPYGLAAFMRKDKLNNLLIEEKDYFNSYFTDKKLNIDSANISSIITTESIISSGKFMKDDMQSMIHMFPIIAIIIYVIIMLLLSKMIIDNNDTGISMLKIFGYSEKELRKMYLNLTFFVVVICVLVSLPLQLYLVRECWPSCIDSISGFFEFTMDVNGYVYIVATGILSYLIANFINMRRLQKVSMAVAIKDQY
jgi:putative ABC transport system permease protein